MSNNIELISYAGTDYPTRYVIINTLGEVLISTTQLNDALVDANGAYCSQDAALLDERICYFVEPDDIFLEESKLSHLLENELGFK
jgi:hypothetical protein